MLNRRSAHAERAMDEVRKRFGDNAVVRGIAYTAKPASPSSLRRKDP
jgi:DNA polymerase-4